MPVLPHSFLSLGCYIQPIERLGQNKDGMHHSPHAIPLRKNPEEEGVFNSKLPSILCRLPQSKSSATLLVTLSLPALLPHHCGRPLLTISAAGWKVISSSSPAASVLWPITMQLRIVKLPPALLLPGNAFSLWTRSSWNFHSLPLSSVLSLGRPSRPLQAPAPTTAA